MATVYLPVEPQLGMTSAERAEAQLTQTEAEALGWFPDDPL